MTNIKGYDDIQGKITGGFNLNPHDDESTEPPTPVEKIGEIENPDLTKGFGLDPHDNKSDKDDE